jgi:hypothetical protein
VEAETKARGMDGGSPPAPEPAKKTYEKAELTIRGDLKDVTGGGDPVS